MKNSQYVNSVNVNISEIARLTFQEQMPQYDGEMSTVITVSMHVEFLKHMYETIGRALSDHAETLANVKKNREVN